MYLVIEIQTFADDSISTPAYAYDALEKAWSKYYGVLSAAAISKLPVHAAVLVDNCGYLIDSKAFKHEEEEENADS